MQPMTSQKLPRIDKFRLLERIENLTKRRMNAIRNNPLKEFMKLRSEFKSNQITTKRKKNIEDRTKIQTRLGDKVIIFQSVNKEITMKTKHDII